MAKLEEIFKQKVNKTIDKETVHKFSLEEERFYLLVVSAKAQAWWQRLRRRSRKFWSDAELEIYLDDNKIPLKFNGNSLWNTRQFIIVVSKLSQGDHSIKLIPKFDPFVEQFSLYKILEFADLDILKLTESQPEDTFLSNLISKSKPWTSLHSPLSVLLSIKIEAQAKSGKQLLVLTTDDEDLQIKLNGKRQLNKEPKAHEYWYWCGRTLKGAAKVFEKSFKKEDNITFLELLSDRTPQVTQFTISLNRIPTRDDPKWTGDFDDDTGGLLLARLIFGEAENQSREAKIGVGFTVINRVKKQRSNWGLTNREVILKKGAYDAFWNPDRRGKVRDPLADADTITREAWQESYEIAVGILNFSIKDTTKGATNFHSFKKKENFPNWATDKNYRAKFGAIYFYELDR